MEITVQWIRTSWTKRSRGGDAAAMRNGAPTAFPVALVAPSFAQVIKMSGHDDFAPRESSDVFLSEPTALVDECGPVR